LGRDEEAATRYEAGCGKKCSHSSLPRKGGFMKMILQIIEMAASANETLIALQLLQPL
jgi:hypothetical protein